MLGPVSEITGQNFGGYRLAVEVGGGPVSLGYFYSPASKGANNLGVVGSNFGIGAGAPFLNGNVNYRYTLIGQK